MLAKIGQVVEIRNQFVPGNKMTWFADPAPAPVPTKEDFKRMLAAALAKSEQDRENKRQAEKRAQHEKDQDAKIARLMGESETRAKNTPDPTTKAILDMMLAQKNQKDNDKKIQKMVDDRLGISNGGWGGSNGGGYGNGNGYGNNRLMPNGHDVYDRDRRYQRLEKRLEFVEDDNDYVVRRISRGYNSTI